jgi:hypothetical protein
MTAALRKSSQYPSETNIRRIAVVPQPTTSKGMHRAMCSVVAQCARVMGDARGSHVSSSGDDGGAGASDAPPRSPRVSSKQRRSSDGGRCDVSEAEPNVHRLKPSPHRSCTALDSSSNTDNEWFKKLGDSLTTTTSSANSALLTDSSRELDINDLPKETAAALLNGLKQQEGDVIGGGDAAVNGGGGKSTSGGAGAGGRAGDGSNGSNGSNGSMVNGDDIPPAPTRTPGDVVPSSSSSNNNADGGGGGTRSPAAKSTGGGDAGSLGSTCGVSAASGAGGSAVGLSLPGVRLVTWTVWAVINWCK